MNFSCLTMDESDVERALREWEEEKGEMIRARDLADKLDMSVKKTSALMTKRDWPVEKTEWGQPTKWRITL